MATDTAGEVQLTGTGTRVHGDWLADDEAIGDELADGLAGVGVGDLVDLVGVEPDLALAAAEDISREALLSSQVDPIHAEGGQSALHFFLMRTMLNRDETRVDVLPMCRHRMVVWAVVRGVCVVMRATGAVGDPSRLHRWALVCYGRHGSSSSLSRSTIKQPIPACPIHLFRPCRYSELSGQSRFCTHILTAVAPDGRWRWFVGLVGSGFCCERVVKISSSERAKRQQQEQVAKPQPGGEGTVRPAGLIGNC